MNVLFEQYRKPMKYAIAYARYSSDRQREESIDAQIRAIKDYCEKENIKLVAIFTDEAQSGKSSERDNFQEMITGIIKDRYNIDYVLVHKFNRFARNQYDSAIYKKKLKEKGVKVVSVTQKIDDTPEGAMMERFLEAMDEYYSANLAAEVRKGLRENALKGKIHGGVVPFGFDVDENMNYVPNKDAAIVRRIFEDIAAGVPKAKVVERLNAEGIRNSKGKQFCTRILYDMLRNEKYIGNYIYTIDKKEIIRLDGIIKNPIIDRELWDKVQEIHREPVRKRYGQKQRIYFLTGKTVCGECGDVICGGGSKKSRGGNIYVYYKCNGKVKKKNGCKSTSLNKEWIEARVLKAVLNSVLSKEQIEQIACDVYERLEKERKEPAVSTDQLKKELVEIAKKQERLTDLYLDGTLKKAMLDEKNHELARRQNEIENELKRRRNVVDASAITKEAIAEYIESYIQQLQKHYSSNDEDFMNAVFTVFVDKVTVYNEKVVIDLKSDFDTVRCGDNITFGGLIRTLAPIKETISFSRKENQHGRNYI